MYPLAGVDTEMPMPMPGRRPALVCGTVPAPVMIMMVVMLMMAMVAVRLGRTSNTTYTVRPCTYKL